MKIYTVMKKIYYFFFRKTTVGARALVIKDDCVLLIEHTYMPGWYTIGGKVESGESPRQAIQRELLEEVGIVAHSLELFNIYHSQNQMHDDYIALYLCKEFSEHDSISILEIKQKKWFKLNELPSNITPATLKRIKEYKEELVKSERW